MERTRIQPGNSWMTDCCFIQKTNLYSLVHMPLFFCSLCHKGSTRTWKAVCPPDTWVQVPFCVGHCIEEVKEFFTSSKHSGCNLVYWKVFGSMAVGWNRMIFKVFPNPNHSWVEWKTRQMQWGAGSCLRCRSSPCWLQHWIAVVRGQHCSFAVLTGKQWEAQCCWMLGSRGDPLLKLKAAAEPRHGHLVIALLHRLVFP